MEPDQQTAPDAPAERWNKRPVTNGDVVTFFVGYVIVQFLAFLAEVAWRLWHG